MALSPRELERYDRQIRISEWRIEGQKKLKKAKVVVAGIGGLGGLAALYLAAAGVGKLILVDKGRFELSNLNRQILGWEKDVGRLKVQAAKEKLEALNPEIEIETVTEEITEANIDSIIKNAHAIIDGMDNWKTRFILNKACVLNNIPFVHAGVSEFHGQITTIMPGEGPCLRCILPRNPPEKEK
ncbi:adenylyltransferase, partial [Candidatus Bathyarchaeota archaeon]